MWCEKYKPGTLEEVVGHEKLKNTIKKCMEKNDLPHFFFFGKTGTGKTVIAELIAKDFLGADMPTNFIYLNASDDRSITRIRDLVLNAIKHSTINGKLRIILLDEADGLLLDAQEVLRGAINKCNRTRFILTANNDKKVIEPLSSRCLNFYFRGLKLGDIAKRLKYIRDMEYAEVDDSEIERIAANCDGDMRRAINELEKLHYSGTDEDWIEKFG